MLRCLKKGDTMKLDYLEICKINYQTKNYLYLLDENNKVFFLNINDKGLSYITLQELLNLQKAFFNYPYACNIKSGKKYHMTPKIIIGGVLITLTLGLTSLFSKTTTTNYSTRETISSTENKTPSDIEKYIENNYLNKPVEIDTYKDIDFSKYIYFYDMNYLTNDYVDNANFETLRQTVQNNSHINLKYKTLLQNYINDLEKNNYDVDVRVFNENLKTIEFIECSKSKLAVKSLSTDSYACYRKDENKIYLLENLEFQNDAWANQVIYHEITHALREARWEKNDKYVRVQFCDSSGYGDIIEEAMNSVFAINLYNKQEKDIAYQLQSNYIKLILSLLDNYKLSDYINHNFSYFEECLNRQNDNDEAKRIMALIELQYKDFHNDELKVEQEQYYPIYDYIVTMYLNKYANQEMTLYEIEDLVIQVKEQILYDVPKEYNINEEYFNQIARTYYNRLNPQGKLKNSI